MTTDDRTLERVRALLRKAERTDNHHEAELFSAKAAQMMADLQIDRAMLGDLDPDADPLDAVWHPMGKYPRASAQILHAAAAHFGCILGIRGSRHDQILIRGHASDIDATRMLYESLRLQADRAMLSTPTPPGMSTVTYRNSFLYGYAARLDSRLADVRAAAVASTPDPTGTALALRDRALAVRESSPATRRANLNGPRVDMTGAAAGDAAARRADLGNTRLGSGEGRKALGR